MVHKVNIKSTVRIGLLLWAMALANGTLAQRMVKSGTYNTMLKTLLKHTVPVISVDSLKACQQNVTLLDAREPAEFAVSHIANALPVGYNQFSLDLVKTLDKGAPVVVYCSVGYRSERVAEKLKAAGFTDVRNLYGGIFEWKNQRQPVVDTNGDTTQRVHAYNKIWGVWLKNAQKVYNN
jgi:rhodanese-related sulfurtransferase